MTEENPFDLKDSREVYKNPWIQVREDSVIRPDGTEGIFGVVEMKPGVTVVALTPERHILLAREYKYAVKRFTLECVSGGMDAEETPLDAAKRELKEETGGDAETWIDLGKIDPFTTVMNSPNYLYLAQNTVVKNNQSPDGGEVIDLVRIPFAEAVRKVENGEITHGTSVVGILKVEKMLKDQQCR